MPIKRIVVDGHLPVAYGDGVLVRWVVNEDFPPDRQPLTHTVLVGNSPTDNFSKIGVVENDTQFLDDQKRVLTRTQDVWYALMTVDARGERYFSPPQKLGTLWRKREWLIAREVVRQARVRLIKRRAGVRGFLLRRRVIGQPCPVCLDQDTGRIKDPSCLTCYGTGITGGYYPPFECYVDQNPEQLAFRIDPQQGMLTEKISTWACLAYPPFHPNDYWVDSASGLRYQVRETIAVTSRLENVPLTVQLQVEAENLNHVIYRFPINCT